MSHTSLAVTPRVLIVAKAPVPGRSKTRLAPPLTPDQAAGVQRALLLDTLAACREEVADVALLHADPQEAAALKALAGEGIRLIVQDGRGLEEALSGGMRRLLKEGPVAMVSSDIPGTPPGSLGRAFAALATGADVVLGPAADGGYWLIAMCAYHPEPFRGIPWSSPAVFAATVRRCADAGLRVHLLEPWRDVDTAADLDVLLAGADALDAPCTMAELRSLEAAGAIGREPPAVELDTTDLLDTTPWRSAVRDHLLVRGDTRTSYTYLAVPRAVFVVPVTDDGEIVLVRQYRHPIRDWTLEVPAGTVDESETPLDAARRELAEEAGGCA